MMWDEQKESRTELELSVQGPRLQVTKILHTHVVKSTALIHQ